MVDKLLKYRPSAAYLLLFALFAVAYAWRASSLFWIDPISSHISNFAIIGGIVLLIIGPQNFKERSARNKVLQICITFAVINCIVEIVNIGDLQLPGLTFLAFNTSDIIDAMYGLLAVIIIALTYQRQFK